MFRNSFSASRKSVFHPKPVLCCALLFFTSSRKCGSIHMVCHLPNRRETSLILTDLEFTKSIMIEAANSKLSPNATTKQLCRSQFVVAVLFRFQVGWDIRQPYDIAHAELVQELPILTPFRDFSSHSLFWLRHRAISRLLLFSPRSGSLARRLP